MARIMVVDDAVLARRIMRNVLTAGGHEVICEVKCGEDALAAYEQERPDLVMMDVNLPGKDGVTVAREILKADDTAKVIMVTSIGRQAVVQEALSSGASGYIMKPYSNERVLGEVQHVLSSKRTDSAKAV